MTALAPASSDLSHRVARPAAGAERVGVLSALLAERLGLARERVEMIRQAAPMHDVGKVRVPRRLLRKPGPLTPEERAEVQRHTEHGHALLADAGGAVLDLAATIALTHHERFDGTGYPRGLAGEDIPLEGRIVAVAEVHDALSSDRWHRPALAPADVLATLRAGRGTQFDPRVLDVLLELLGA